MNNHIKILFICGTLFSLGSFSYAQKTVVSGKVYDAKTGEPLPFVNVAFKNSKIGTITDENGYYKIETYYATDSLIASFLGYNRLAKKVKKDQSQTIDFPLQQSSIQLQEVVVKYKKEENPAHPIMRNVIRYKKINNREKLDAYQYEVYNKVEFDINNIDENFKNQKALKPFQFVFDYIDTTDEKPYLPIFISEAVSEYYYKRLPKLEKEIIKATRISGIENKTVSQFLGDMYQNVNIYDNYINIFGKSFISPVSDFGFFSYRYYLTDSGYIDKSWCYKIKFVPKRKHELTFNGEMWINDTTYAVKKVSANITKEANINFIKRFEVEQTYQQIEPEVWMLTNDKLTVDFNLSDKQAGFYGRKSTYYRNFVINQPLPDEFYLEGNDIVVEEGSDEKPEDYWDKARAEELSEKEKNIYQMVDSIKNVPAFRTYVDIIQLIVTGYHVWKKVELGPYFTTYSFNQVEGNRFRIGGRTNNEFSTRLMIEAYLAYGTRDKKFKYGAWFNYFLTKFPRQHFGISYKRDVEQLGQSQNAWRQDNILASLFRRNPFNKINGYEEYSGFFEREWFFGFSNKISLTHRKIWPLGVLNFEKSTEGGSIIPVNNIITAEVGVYTRFAYKEKYVSGEFERINLGTKWPILQVQYYYGFQNFFNSQYEYHKIIANIQDKMKINPLGEMEYMLEAGKLFGTLPYPLLFLHNGNETYFYDFSAFNLMNYYEFGSDQYLSLAVTHHFNGLFFNKIPLINKLKWREVASAKAVYGTLSGKHQQEMIFPANFSGLNSGPYVEGGVGIENIFKLIRVDALWRFSYLNHPNIVPWGIRATFQFMF